MTTEIFREVCEQLDALKRRGVKVPRMAYTVAASEADGFHNSGMSVAEVAGFCISLAGVKTTKGRLASGRDCRRKLWSRQQACHRHSRRRS